VVTSYELVGAINRDTARFSSWGGPTPGSPSEQNLATRSGLTLLTMDPPRHGPYRRLISGAFAPNAIMALEQDVVRPLTNELVSAFISTGGGDFCHRGCRTRWTSHHRCDDGIDRADEALIVRCSNAIAVGSDPEYGPNGPEGVAVAAEEFFAYAGKIARRAPTLSAR